MNNADKNIEQDPPTDHIDDSNPPEKSTTSDSTKQPMAPVESTEEPPYTTWTVRKRRLIIFLLGYLSLASSLTANAYFPLLNVLSEKFDTSLQAINLTITMFYIFQGIAPSFWSPLSDSFGRRPVYLGTFLVYTAGSLGLVLSGKSYTALLLSRALQSVGGSSVLSLSYAVVADLCVHSERGSFIAPMMAAANVGPLIGPIIGGGSALATGSPEWAFRSLFIFGATGLILIGLCLPETLRTIVGNGSTEAQGLWKTWLELMFRAKHERRDGKDEESQTGSALDEKHVNGEKSKLTIQDPVNQPTAIPPATSTAPRIPTGRGHLVIPNPIPVLRIIGYLDSFLVLCLAASPYTLWAAFQTAMTPILSSAPFGLNPFQVSLCFLAGGTGTISGGFIAGKLMDINYRHVALKAGITVDKRKGDDIAAFPIEHARSRWSIRVIVVSLPFIVGYGWAVQLATRQVHLTAVLVLQLLIAVRCTVLHQVYSALLTDVFPEKTGTAAAANNIVRCTLSGIVVAVLEPLSAAMGWGWLYTTLGFIDAVGCIVAILALRRYGKVARDRRHTTPSACPPVVSA